jgi:hypothetical protein
MSSFDITGYVGLPVNTSGFGGRLFCDKCQFFSI